MPFLQFLAARLSPLLTLLVYVLLALLLVPVVALAVPFMAGYLLGYLWATAFFYLLDLRDRLARFRAAWKAKAEAKAKAKLKAEADYWLAPLRSGSSNGTWAPAGDGSMPVSTVSDTVLLVPDTVFSPLDTWNAGGWSDSTADSSASCWSDSSGDSSACAASSAD